MIKKVSYLLISGSLFIIAMTFLLKTIIPEPVFAKTGYEVPRARLAKFQIFTYKNLLGLFDPAKGQIYFYKDNIYIKTFRIREPGGNLMILY